ncbi:hypothetical protein TRFO_12370 [Tritrichomonas foetus]|uniref:Uncharacterized protein n=1 Tax=Tritrichomonas foetus TaxID=1144522 RepID=A0A1J4L637_9EUKA|nr:hypothetical protein TRFO_12370 [Tritrichomonas foetus]|eukprot:OHT17414.1 hypothetical protein TRFO_12370 [Tritrichomonas foetus]
MINYKSISDIKKSFRFQQFTKDPDDIFEIEFLEDEETFNDEYIVSTFTSIIGKLNDLLVPVSREDVEMCREVVNLLEMLSQELFRMHNQHQILAILNHITNEIMPNHTLFDFVSEFFLAGISYEINLSIMKLINYIFTLPPTEYINSAFICEIIEQLIKMIPTPILSIHDTIDDIHYSNDNQNNSCLQNLQDYSCSILYNYLTLYIKSSDINFRNNFFLPDFDFFVEECLSGLFNVKKQSNTSTNILKLLYYVVYYFSESIEDKNTFVNLICTFIEIVSQKSNHFGTKFAFLSLSALAKYQILTYLFTEKVFSQIFQKCMHSEEFTQRYFFPMMDFMDSILMSGDESAMNNMLGNASIDLFKLAPTANDRTRICNLFTDIIYTARTKKSLIVHIERLEIFRLLYELISCPEYMVKREAVESFLLVLEYLNKNVIKDLIINNSFIENIISFLGADEHMFNLIIQALNMIFDIIIDPNIGDPRIFRILLEQNVFEEIESTMNSFNNKELQNKVMMLLERARDMM